MGTKEILRRIWVISAKKIKPSEAISKQNQVESSENQTQVIILTNNCQIKMLFQIEFYCIVLFEGRR